MAWQKTVVLVLEVDFDEGIIGWTGFADEHSGLPTTKSMGLGVDSSALSEIVSWLRREIRRGTSQVDGPTDG